MMNRQTRLVYGSGDIKIILLFFLGGCFCATIIYIVRKIAFKIQNQKKKFFPLWHSWVVATSLRFVGLIVGYALIHWYVRENFLSSQKVTQIIFAYTVPIFFGLLVDLLKEIKKV